MDYTSILRKYETKEKIPFYLLNKRIEFPSDRTLDIYDSILIDSDIPWTILSYKLYGSITYWWILCALNTSSLFYAKENSNVYYIKREYLETILSSINNA